MVGGREQIDLGVTGGLAFNPCSTRTHTFSPQFLHLCLAGSTSLQLGEEEEEAPWAEWARLPKPGCQAQMVLMSSGY